MNKLHAAPARPLTSREIAKIISGLVGSLAQWCEPAEIEAAFAHFHEHAERYSEAWRVVHRTAKSADVSLTVDGQ